MKTFLVALISMLAVSAFADSQYLDRESLRNCGGAVELRLADNGDLALKFEGRINRDYCDRLRFVDVSSRNVIRSYDFRGSSYTLSKDMRRSLGSDCAVEVQLLNYHGNVVERKRVTLTWCAPVYSPRPVPPVHRPGGYVTYEWSREGHCKIMIDGRYSGRNTPEYDKYLCRSQGRRY